MYHYPKDLLTLIAQFKKLPGVGRKTAERFAFQILDWQEKEIQDFASVLQTLKERVLSCDICGCLMSEKACTFCTSSKRQQDRLCIIASPRDALAIEATGSFQGLYHVLGALLSPLDGKNLEALQLKHLYRRFESSEIKEVIIALDATLEGDATALYLKRQLLDRGLEVSRLALGLPMGSSFDYIDEGTLSLAFEGRRPF